MTLIEELHDLPTPSGLSVSSNGRQVVYTTGFYFGHKKGEHAVTTVWLAETGKKHSARQLTSGMYNDRNPKWSPDGTSIAFTSDRHKQGESSAIYLLPLSGGEPYPVTPAEHVAGIASFAFHPNGKSIAFLSADEKSEEKKTKEKEKDDAKVWGEDWPYQRLRLVDIASKSVSVLVSKDAHLTHFAWNDDGSSIAFAENKTPDTESPFWQGTDFSVVDTSSKEVKHLCPSSKEVGAMVYCGSTVYFLGPASDTFFASAYMVLSIDVNAKEPTCKKFAHGETDCALKLSKAGGDAMVLVESGMEDQIRVLGGKTVFSSKKAIEHIFSESWSAAFTTDSDEIVIAITQSDVNHPPEVFSTTASGGALVQLSNHHPQWADRKLGASAVLECKSFDDKYSLDGMWYTPHAEAKSDGTPSKPLPTAVLIHGGPYGRINEAFDAYYFMWGPLLLSHGYAVLMPNYRGGSSRGDDFAAYGRQCGEEDYEDVIALTNHAVEKGYADKERLLVGGWSQGGFLTFVCSVRNGTHGYGWKFQASIPGAGVSDTDTMTMSSDLGRIEGEMGSGKPWEQSKNDTRNRKASPFWEFGDAMKNKVAIPPMLILHGEEDKRVPLEQSVGMRRALEDHGLPFEFVTYPRAGHIPSERKHLMDMSERVLKWCDKYIGGK